MGGVGVVREQEITILSIVFYLLSLLLFIASDMQFCIVSFHLSFSVVLFVLCCFSWFF